MLSFDAKAALLMPISQNARLFVPCGSRVTCNPPPMDTDEDYLVLIAPTDWERNRIQMEQAGWRLGGADYAIDDPRFSFQSWTFDELNLIMTDSLEFYDKHQIATYICKTMNIMAKEYRVMVFQAVLYGQMYTPVPPIPFAPITQETL
jgi:hypothetical protein